jgi:hypothetical protein
VQGGANTLLAAKDVTGCTPAELASEKGHRYLANYLRDYKEKEENQHKLCGKAGALSWLTSTQLCPVIWLIIIGLLALFVHKVRMLAVEDQSSEETEGACSVKATTGW